MFAVLYFAYISTYCAGLLSIGFGMQIIGNIAFFFVPESPKFLFKKGDIGRTASVLKRIAKINGADPSLVDFEHVESEILGAKAISYS